MSSPWTLIRQFRELAERVELVEEAVEAPAGGVPKPVFSQIGLPGVTTQANAGAQLGGPSVLVPEDGDYIAIYGATMTTGGGGRVRPYGPGGALGQTLELVGSANGSQWPASRASLLTGLVAGQTIELRYGTAVALTDAGFSQRWLVLIRA